MKMKIESTSSIQISTSLTSYYEIFHKLKTIQEQMDYVSFEVSNYI